MDGETPPIPAESPTPDQKRIIDQREGSNEMLQDFSRGLESVAPQGVIPPIPSSENE